MLAKLLLGIIAATALGLPTPVYSADRAADGNQEKEARIGPVEDLMREHGVLRRVLLVFEEQVRRLEQQKEVKPESIAKAVDITQRFIQDYHEKLEEDFVFPRVKDAGKDIELVKILRQQHESGRRLMKDVKKLATADSLKDADKRRQLATSIQLFVRMYRAHAAREDTVLFPDFHDITQGREYDKLGEQFEAKERQLFGEKGFEKIVEEVATLEKELGIYDLSRFTPKPDDAAAASR